MQEMWGATGNPEACISSTVLTVPSRVEPPAPYVTEKKCGRTCASRAHAARSFPAASSDLGGKNSKLKVHWTVLIASEVVASSAGRSLLAPHQQPQQRGQHGVDQGPEHAAPEASILRTTDEPLHGPEAHIVDYRQEQ